MANRVQFNKTEFSVGDTVAVHHKFEEGGKKRVQIFRGTVIALRGSGENKSFTVRKIAAGGIGVERIWPLACPSISKIVVRKKGKVRRAKLYYLRKEVGKNALWVKKLDRKKETRGVVKPTEVTEKKTQQSQKISAPSVSKKNIRAKAELGKIRRETGKEVSSG